MSPRRPPEVPGPVLLDKTEIARRVGELGEEINEHYRGERIEEITVVSVLKGGFIFLADLIRHLRVDLRLDFIAISSYHDADDRTRGVRILKDLSESIYRRHVLLVEDIIDTGLTLSFIMRNLREREPADIRLCTLLDRSARRIAPLELHYRGFEVGDEYLVGYGLDYRQFWRNLPSIHVLEDKQAVEAAS